MARLYVGNLPMDVTEREIDDLFYKYVLEFFNASSISKYFFYLYILGIITLGLVVFAALKSKPLVAHLRLHSYLLKIVGMQRMLCMIGRKKDKKCFEYISISVL